MDWYTKAKRARNVDDFETWKRGGVSPTLNAMDNNGEAYATVLAVFEPKSAFEENWAESKVKNALRAGASKSSHAIVGTLQSRDAKGLNHEGARDGKAIVASTGVRRLTPLECERLQGFPDNWTDGQADSNRYKQTGNAVAVPVVEWIINRLVEVDSEMNNTTTHGRLCTELQVLYGEDCTCQERA